jgi:hypothetical protein
LANASRMKPAMAEAGTLIALTIWSIAILIEEHGLALPQDESGGRAPGGELGSRRSSHQLVGGERTLVERGRRCQPVACAGPT